MKKYNVAVVGVGAVGREMLRVLSQRNFPIKNLYVFARSSRDISVDKNTYSVKEIGFKGFKGIDLALFAGTEGEKGASVTYAKKAIRQGAIVIDNGADFRLDPKVPLVVPEVNPKDLSWHKGLIASPNCSTIQMVVSLWPIHKATKIVRVVVSTYQAASGAGQAAVNELKVQSEAALKGEKIEPQVLPKQIVFNVFPQVGKFEELDFTTEEWKTVKETQKIFHDKTIKISSTCVRVPVFNVHSQSIYIETKKKLSVADVKEILSKEKSIKLMDEPKKELYPTPIEISSKDEVFVGRIRQDPFIKNGLWLWVVADNLRKGAALNAIQIAEELIKR